MTREDILNLPNKITVFRIFLIPLIVVFLISHSREMYFLAALIFLIASITDWLDGYIARSTKQVTNLGKFLDPVADKLLTIATLIPLVGIGRVPAWMAVVILGREFAVTGLRAIASSEGIVIPAENLGKYKMTSLTIAIIFLILHHPFYFIDLHFWGMVALWISMILSLISGIKYGLKFWGQIESLQDN